jgi:hypothetical protein
MGVDTPLGSVSLGLYPAEHAAHRAAVEFRRRGPSVERYPAIVEELVRLGLVPATLLPKWVYRTEGGYGARRVTRSGAVEVGGPCPTPGEAFTALYALLPRVRRPEPKKPEARHRREAGRIALRYRRGGRVEDLAGEYRVSPVAIYRLLDAVGEPRRPGRPYHPAE